MELRQGFQIMRFRIIRGYTVLSITSTTSYDGSWQ